MKRLFGVVLAVVLCFATLGFTACVSNETNELIWYAEDMLKFCDKQTMTFPFPEEEGSRNVKIITDVYNVAVHNIEDDKVVINYTDNEKVDVTENFDETTETVTITQQCKGTLLSVNVFLGLVVGIPQNWTDFTLELDVGTSNLSIENSKAKTIKINGETSSVRIIPYEQANDSISIETKTGSVEFSGDTNNLQVEVGAGSVDVTGQINNLLDVQTSTGTIKLHDTSVDNVKLATKTGSINVDTFAIATKMDLSTETGSIQLNGSAQTIIAQTNTGSINVDAPTVTDLQLTTNTGSIKFTIDNTHKIYAKSNSGSIRGTIKGEKSLYTIKVTQSSGSCNIHDQEGTSDRQLTVNANNGSINVKFK